MITFNDVYEELKEMILEVKDFEEEEIHPHMTLEELDFDSLDFVQLTVIVKKKFDVTLTGEPFEAGEVKNLKDVCEHVVGLA